MKKWLIISIRISLLFFTSQKIANHNVMSFVNSTKQNQIIQEALLNNIDILGLSETNLPFEDTKFQKSHLPEDYVYFFESTKLHKGSGVGLCIKKALSNHIFYHYQSSGRYILIDLQLRNKQKLHIIQLYLHANNQQINQKQILEREIINHLTKAKQKQYHLLFIEDFNVNVDNTSSNRQ